MMSASRVHANALSRLAGWVLCAMAPLAHSHEYDIGGTFSLERIDAEEWRAEYCLETRIAALRWYESMPGMREAAWRVESDGFRMSYSQSYDGVTAERGTPFECIAFRISTYTELGPKHYYAFSPFSDGGVSVYAGYFTAEVFITGGWHRLSLTASYKGLPGERVIAARPTALERQFVYFGPGEPAAQDTAVIVADPAVPRETATAVVESLEYADRTLEELFGWRPDNPFQVLIAAGQLDDGDGYSIKGGALERQILFTLKGKGALGMIRDDPVYMPRLVAHETLHLWQNDLWPELGSRRPWMHEGSADALAADLLFGAGIIDGAAYAALISGTRASCIDRLAGTSVHAAPDEGRFDVVYTCGAVVNWLFAEAIGEGDVSAGLRSLWRAMAAWDESRRDDEGESLWFATLAELGVSESARAAVASFLSTVHDDPSAALDRLTGSL